MTSHSGHSAACTTHKRNGKPGHKNHSKTSRGTAGRPQNVHTMRSWGGEGDLSSSGFFLSSSSPSGVAAGENGRSDGGGNEEVRGCRHTTRGLFTGRCARLEVSWHAWLHRKAHSPPLKGRIACTCFRRVGIDMGGCRAAVMVRRGVWRYRKAGLHSQGGIYSFAYLIAREGRPARTCR